VNANSVEVDEEAITPVAALAWPVNGGLLALVQVVFAVFLATYLAGTIVEPGYYFDLTVGNWILANNAVPKVDLWTAIGFGRPWIDLNWLHQAVVAASFRAFGERGPYGYKVLLYVVVIFSSARTFASLAGSRFVGHLLSAIFCAASLASGPFGSEIVALALVVGYLALCTGQSKLTWPRMTAVLVLLALHANVHSSAPFAALLVAALTWRRFSPAGLLPLLLIATQFITPWLGSQILAAVSSSSSDLITALVEHRQAATVFDFGFSFSILITAILFIFAINGGRLNTREIWFSIALVVLMLVDRSFTPYALLALVCNVASMWGRSLGVRNSQLGIGIDKLQSSLVKLPVAGTLFLLICITIVNTAQVLRDPVNDVGLPVEEAELILNQPSISQVLTGPDIAPYVIYALSDMDGNSVKRLSADLRVRVFNPAVLSSLKNFESLTDNWAMLLEHVKPDVVIVRARSAVAAVCSEPEFAAVLRGATQSPGRRSGPSWKICDKWSLSTQSGKEGAS
jgi:hypothetical protein